MVTARRQPQIENRCSSEHRRWLRFQRLLITPQPGTNSSAHQARCGGRVCVSQDRTPAGRHPPEMEVVSGRSQEQAERCPPVYKRSADRHSAQGVLTGMTKSSRPVREYRPGPGLVSSLTKTIYVQIRVIGRYRHCGQKNRVC